MSQKQCVLAHARSRKRRLGAGMAAADDNHAVLGTENASL